MSPSDAIAWDQEEELGPLQKAGPAPLPMGYPLIFSPEPRRLLPAELGPAEGIAGCTQPEPEEHSSWVCYA